KLELIRGDGLGSRQVLQIPSEQLEEFHARFLVQDELRHILGKLFQLNASESSPGERNRCGCRVESPGRKRSAGWLRWSLWLAFCWCLAPGGLRFRCL